MSTVIKGGTVVTADLTYQADVLVEDGRIADIGKNLSGDETLDAAGCYVMPGGIDPHTHLEMPFMGTYSSDDFESGTRAALAGGTTMVVDFALPSPEQSLIDALGIPADDASLLTAERAIADTYDEVIAGTEPRFQRAAANHLAARTGRAMDVFDIAAGDRGRLVIAGGVAGVMAIAGATLLVHRRLYDPRVRAASSTSDTLIIILLWIQLALGLLTIPVSLQHLDGHEMVKFMSWAQGILTLQPGMAALIADANPIFKLHIFLGMTIFLVFPFTRLVHIWSAPIWYLGRRGYQIVRSSGRRQPPRTVTPPPAVGRAEGPRHESLNR